MIYFVRIKDDPQSPVKIGHSLDPIKRLNDLMVWSPRELFILGIVQGAVIHERAVQRCLKAHLSHKEWFHWTPEVEKTVNGIIDGTVCVLALREQYSKGDRIYKTQSEIIGRIKASLSSKITRAKLPATARKLRLEAQISVLNDAAISAGEHHVLKSEIDALISKSVSA